jgi:hypothetical protein
LQRASNTAWPLTGCVAGCWARVIVAMPNAKADRAPAPMQIRLLLMETNSLRSEIFI